MKTNPLKKWSVLGTGVALLTTSFAPVIQAQEQEKPVQRVKPAGGILGKLLNQRKKGDRVRSIGNCKQLYLLMIEFDDDFGSFPSDKTAAAEKDLAAYKGKHSNDYLGQFLAGGYVQSEEIFYARGGAPTDKKPDNDISTKAKTLEAGECGFAYYKGLSTSNNSGLPLLLAPMTGKGYKFDPIPYEGKATVLRIDGSVQLLEIDANGDAILRNGKKLFEGGAGTVWGEKGPDAKSLVFPK